MCVQGSTKVLDEFTTLSPHYTKAVCFQSVSTTSTVNSEGRLWMIMMVSSNGSFFRVTDPVTGEFPDKVPVTRTLMFLWCGSTWAVKQTFEWPVIWDYSMYIIIYVHILRVSFCQPILIIQNKKYLTCRGQALMMKCCTLNYWYSWGTRGNVNFQAFYKQR